MSSGDSILLTGNAADPAHNLYLHHIRNLIYEASGIFHPENKFRYLQEHCVRRMKVLGVKSLAGYMDFLTGPKGPAEMRRLLNEVTIGETSFFRNQPQLDAFTRHVLPGLVREKSAHFHQLKIWSAGCSTGEESYTLAILLLEEAKSLLKGWSLQVVATDLNDRSLACAARGIYGDYTLRNVPPSWRRLYFTSQDQRFRVSDAVRSLVTFSRVNLLDDARMVLLKGMDAIFCCNVLIYFDGNSKRRVMQHFYENLLPHGYLFLGHSESLFGVSGDFELAHFPGTTVYRKIDRQPEISHINSASQPRPAMRVLVADDSALTCAAPTSMLRSDSLPDLVGSAGNGADVRKLRRRARGRRKRSAV